MADREHRLVSRIIDILRSGTARVTSPADAGTADAVLVLGEDVTNTAPLLALSLRQAVRQEELGLAAKVRIPAWHDAGVRNAGQGRKSPLFIAAPAETPLDDIAARTWHAAPDDIARLGFAVAHELDEDAPAVPGLPREMQDLAAEIARALKSAKRPLIVAGTSLASEPVIQAAANAAAALRRTGSDAGLCFTLSECNTMGLGLLAGRNLGEAFTAMADGLADTVIVLENDLYRREDAGTIDAFLDKAKQVIVLDHLVNATTERADIVLPAATFAESTGTLVSSEVRAQRSFQVFVPQGDIQAGWKWIDAIMGQPGSRAFDDIVAGLVAAHPVFGPLRDLAPGAGYRMQGQKVPRQPHRSSGRTAMTAHIEVSEPKPADDPDSALAYSMEGAEGQPPPPLISRYWSPGWNSVQALNRFQEEIAGPLRGGEAGARLIAPLSGQEVSSYFTGIPEAFAPQAGAWLLIPLYRVHGSEELSVHAPGIAELAATTRLALGPADAATLGVTDGSLVGLSFGKGGHLLRVRVVEGIPQGVAGYPAGAPGLPGSMGPVFGTIIREQAR
jgi:NADH-quinone oxidoreductase subunit G